jgi:hypothetical protein
MAVATVGYFSSGPKTERHAVETPLASFETEQQQQGDTTRPIPALASPTASDAKPISVAPETLKPTEPVTRFVRARKVALRDGAGKQYGILDRYDTGRAVEVSETDGEWSHVIDQLTRREGWVATALLTDQKPDVATAPTKKERKAPQPAEPPAQKVPTIPSSLIVQRLIAESIATYPGSCACPYNTDRAGRKCGRRSAYNKGGGYAPLCFAGDVTADAVEAFRQRSE